MLLFVNILNVLCISRIMCLHPKELEDRNELNELYKGTSIDPDCYDRCDYVHKHVTKSSDLTIVQLNVRGVISKSSKILHFVNNIIEADIILLCETWLTPFSPTISVPGYEFYHIDRQNKRGGGVGVLIKGEIRHNLETKYRFVSECFENISVLIELKNKKKLLVSSMYRPPNTNAREFVDEYAELLSKMKRIPNCDLVIGLDHNMDLIKSDIHRHTADFISLNLDLLMMPLISRPTRITKSTATLIDNIIVDQSMLDLCSSNILIEDISDHLPSVVSIDGLKTYKKEKVKISSRDTRKRNMDALLAALSKKDWDILITEDVNISFDKLHTELCALLDHFVPFQTHEINYKNLRREKWITPGILNSINTSKKNYRKMLANKHDLKLSKNYNEYAKLLKRTLRYAKKSYYVEKCNLYKSNTKKLWATIHEICGRHNDKSSMIDYLTIDGVKTYEATKISNQFAKYFSTVGKKFANKLPNPVTPVSEYISQIPCNSKSLMLHPCTEIEIDKLINLLPNKTSCGVDEINNILLKKIGKAILPALCSLFNKSMETGVFPESMKLAEVVPLYKGGERSLETNYRPISLLTTLSKILEKIMYKRVYSFLNSTKQIYTKQYGFRFRHSTDQAVCEILAKILKNAEKKVPSVAVFLDLSKAFDTLEHSIVLKKMERYGIRGCVLAWFESYLKNRKLISKCITTSSGSVTKSAAKDIEFGTPQGSCLGPLIFLIFCNDMRLHLAFLECVQFADDTSLIFGHKDRRFLTFAIEHDLTTIQDWFNANKLTLNVTKSVYVVFGDEKDTMKDLIFRIGTTQIPRVPNTKILGLWIDEKMTWNTHIDKILTKVRSRIGLLKYSKNFLTTHAKKVLYYAQIYSILTYGIVVWGTMINQTRRNDLQKVQDECVRQIDTNLALPDIYKTHGLLRIEQIVLLEQLKLGYKLNNDLLPESLASHLTTGPDTTSLVKNHGYKTRAKKVLNIPFAKNSSYRRSFLYQSLLKYNSMNSKLRSEPNLHRFVGACKNEILENIAS